MKLPPGYLLRDLRPSDLAAVMRIEKATYAIPWSESSFQYELTQNPLAHYQALVIRQGDQPGQLVGYSGYWLIADEFTVSAIVVDPGWRGRSLGELLFLNMMRRACQAKAVLATLEVRRSNTAAQQLYAKYGFEIVGERPRYYQDNREDAILMNAEPLDAAYRQTLRRLEADLLAKLR
jgi:[ribosomal protein S18]-alanine N-acetyltransferase